MDFTTPREYTVVKSSKAIKADIDAGVGSGVFPPAERVQEFFAKGGPPPKYKSTTGTSEEGEENCTSYTLVPERGSSPDENFSTGDEGQGKPKNKANPSKWTNEL